MSVRLQEGLLGGESKDDPPSYVERLHSQLGNHVFCDTRSEALNYTEGIFTPSGSHDSFPYEDTNRLATTP